MVAGLVVWAVVRLLGVELTVESGSGTAQVDAVDVLVATLVAGLAAWGVFALLLRRGAGPAGGRSSAAPPWPSP